MQRYLEKHIKKDLKEKIVILSGPRQVGKTTLSKQLIPSNMYLNYDSAADRKIIREEEWARDVELVIFDELHKMKNWKSWIKGIYDTEGIPPSLLVTGSARIETYMKGGDSLAGRFFSYRLHPLTVKEICAFLNVDPKTALDKLVSFGGFPEPYLKNSEAFAKRWRRTHVDTIIREDLLDLERVRDIKSIEILIELLRARVGSSTSFSSLAEDLQVSVHTVKHWLQILENLYVVFPVRPYHRNIARSILKEPKYYLYDPSTVDGDFGAKLENVVALALLRDLHLLEDTTGSKVSLHYLRDKEKNEVDFLTVVDNRPTLMIEVKVSDDSFSKSLYRFSGFLKDARPIQLVYNLRRKKSTRRMEMLSVHDFLAGIGT
ncbi:MAG: ATP-binding protein [Candidatus Aminicenantes bacterium]|nr:ATP-binding protein [Candidatus Aminicenantes bacterium]MDH5707273.1 ATP-binding protein [Candidatus Aminicenantes bacterium]